MCICKEIITGVYSKNYGVAIYQEEIVIFLVTTAEKTIKELIMEVLKQALEASTCSLSD